MNYNNWPQQISLCTQCCNWCGWQGCKPLPSKQNV